MSEPKDQPTATPDAGTPAQGTASQGDDKIKVPNVDTKSVSEQDLKSLYKKIGDLENDNKKYRDKITKSKTDQETKEKKEAEKKGEYKTLYETTLTKLERVEEPYKKNKETLENLLKSQLENLSQDKLQEFNNLFGDLKDPADKLAKFQIWIGKGNILTQDPKMASATPSSKGKNIEDELAAMIKEVSKDPKSATQARGKIDELTKRLLYGPKPS